MEEVHVVEDTEAHTTSVIPGEEETVDTAIEKLPQHSRRGLKIGIAAFIFVLLLITGILFSGLKKSNEPEANDLFPTPTGTPTDTPSLTPTMYPSATPTRTPTPARTPTPTPTPAPTKTPTPAPTSTPTPTPTRTPDPPRMEILFPAEGQVVTQSNPSICVVDVPAGNYQSGMSKKHSINYSAWTNYAPAYSLCYEFPVGANTFSMQYKNTYGEESQVYTRNFIYQPDQN